MSWLVKGWTQPSLKQSYKENQQMTTNPLQAQKKRRVLVLPQNQIHGIEIENELEWNFWSKSLGYKIVQKVDLKLLYRKVRPKRILLDHEPHEENDREVTGSNEGVSLLELF